MCFDSRLIEERERDKKDSELQYESRSPLIEWLNYATEEMRVRDILATAMKSECVQKRNQKQSRFLRNCFSQMLAFFQKCPAFGRIYVLVCWKVEKIPQDHYFPKQLGFNKRQQSLSFL